MVEFPFAGAKGSTKVLIIDRKSRGTVNHRFLTPFSLPMVEFPFAGVTPRDLTMLHSGEG